MEPDAAGRSAPTATRLQQSAGRPPEPAYQLTVLLEVVALHEEKQRCECLLVMIEYSEQIPWVVLCQVLQLSVSIVVRERRRSPKGRSGRPDEGGLAAVPEQADQRVRAVSESLDPPAVPGYPCPLRPSRLISGYLNICSKETEEGPAVRWDRAFTVWTSLTWD